MHATEFLKSTETRPPGPIVALFGGERFLKQAVLARVVQQVLGAGDEAQPTRLAGKNLDLASVVDALLTVSMYNPRSLIVVEDADDFVSECRQGLERYLERPAKKSVLVLDVSSWAATTRLAKRTEEIGLNIDCRPLKPAEMVPWINEACRARQGKKIDRAAAQRLIDLVGADLALIDQELAKLAAYVGTRGTIDLEAVETLVGGWKAETTWKMLDAIRDGHLEQALQLLDRLLTAGEHPLKLLGGVGYVYRPLARATELSRQGVPTTQALAEAGVKPFQVQPVLAYLKRIGRPRAEQFLKQLLQADLGLKGWGDLPERVVIERLILQFGAKELI